jgi:alkylresorcinol/alkylpyrone synthase
MSMGNICSYIFHGGGPKVLRAMENSLSLPPHALAASWNTLRQRGNLSSVSVLTVMQEYLLDYPRKPRLLQHDGVDRSSFCSELLLLQW